MAQAPTFAHRYCGMRGAGLGFCQGTHPEDALAPSLLQRGSYQEGKHSVRLYLKDLREVFPKQGPYDLIFHDPFSPTGIPRDGPCASHQGPIRWAASDLLTIQSRTRWVEPGGLVSLRTRRPASASIGYAGSSVRRCLPAKALPADLQTLPYETRTYA